VEKRVRRNARCAAPDTRANRYSLPAHLQSGSPVGYRTRQSLSTDEARAAMVLLSLPRPEAFVSRGSVREQALFEECSLGVLTSRQSTNFRGHRQVTLGPRDSGEAAALLREMSSLESNVLENACHTHVVLTRPYRTSFTLLLTFIGHLPFLSLLTVPWRALRKRFAHVDDIPTIGYLQHLHLGILAEAMERAAVLASDGQRGAQIFQGPFSDPNTRAANQGAIARLESLCGLTARQRSSGWRIGLVAQVGQLPAPHPVSRALCRKIGANLMAFRSERIQPGVNAEEKAPAQYQVRQDMHVPDALAVMAGRAGYNAFHHWTGCDRERAKELLLLERIDVLSPHGKERLRDIRQELDEITDRLIKALPKWVDWPTGMAFSRNAHRGRKAFALAGQRIYVSGLSRQEIADEGIAWELAIRGLGAGAARGALYCEIMGCVDLPSDCDLLAGICLMAGPVNQNDIGKSFYGYADLLAHAFPDRDPTSLLVWTLKAKTIGDPIGNEEQLLNADRKGVLVDLRAAPHEIVSTRVGGRLVPLRKLHGRTNGERAFSETGNFVTSPEGEQVPGNMGSRWPSAWSRDRVWKGDAE
jgi:hypothetical protein